LFCYATDGLVEGSLLEFRAYPVPLAVLIALARS